MSMLRSRKALVTALLAACSLPLTADAAPGWTLVDAPTPAPEVDASVTGYDWASRVNETHVLLDAGDVLTVHDLRDVRTPLLDVEVRGLVPFHPYSLVGSGSLPIGPYQANPAGEVVFWLLPAQPSAWALVDEETSRQVYGFTFDDSRPAGPHAAGYYYCPMCYQPRNEARRLGQTTAGTIEQAAFSFTQDATVTTTTCFEHSVRVEAKVSGGQAASSSVGGDYLYTRQTCDTIASTGTPVIERQELAYVKDTYPDGSWKIYATGETRAGSSLAENVYFNPPGYSTLWTTNVYFKREVKETDAGGVRFSWGARAFEEEIGVSFSATGGIETRVSIELFPPGGTYRYRFVYIAGDQGSTGIVGAAWRA